MLAVLDQASIGVDREEGRMNVNDAREKMKLEEMGAKLSVEYREAGMEE